MKRKKGYRKSNVSHCCIHKPERYFIPRESFCSCQVAESSSKPKTHTSSCNFLGICPVPATSSSTALMGLTQNEIPAQRELSGCKHQIHAIITVFFKFYAVRTKHFSELLMEWLKRPLYLRIICTKMNGIFVEAAQQPEQKCK